MAKAQKEKTPVGFEFVKELGGIREYRFLKNDLTVLLRRDDTAPVVTFMVTYRVGSRNEATGHTGATHLLEHMMFKGTPTFNREKGTQIAAELQKVGAFFNATTWFDRTNYYEILPTDQLELAMKIEADRMRNSMIREEDHKSEMTVVRNEFDIGENRPERVLHDRLFAHAYIAHPYHHSTIGWRSDIEGVSTERLREFYNTFYWPNNATVSVIGHFEDAEVFRLIETYFGPIPRSPHPIPEVYTTEPPQQGEVRFKLRRSGQLGIVAIAHKTPEALHPDIPALDLLSAVLSMGKSSRFYRDIVHQNLGLTQYSHVYQLRDPSLLITQVTLTPNARHEQVEEIIIRHYRNIQEKGVSEKEFNIARNQLIADIAYDRDGSYAYASRLNEAIASANWEFYVTYLDKLKAVRREDLQAVAQKYFVEDNRVVGYFVPIRNGEPAAASMPAADVPGPAGYSPAGFAGTAAAHEGGSHPLRFADRVRELPLDNGARLYLLKTGVEKVVSIRGAIKAGEVFQPPEKRMVARITAELLDHGTRRRNKFELAEALEHMGAELSFNCGTFHLNIRGRFLSEHTENVFSLLGEILREPAFDEDEFHQVKKQLIASFKKKSDTSHSRAHNLLMQAIFPQGHPYWDLPFEELIRQIEQIQLDEVRQFYQQTYGGRSLRLAVVGDISEKQIEALAPGLFGDWDGGKSAPEVPRVPANDAVERAFRMQDKPNIDVYFGHAGVPRLGDADYIPLLIGNHILGDSPLSSRLGVQIRDTQGLTYSIYSFVSTSNLADGYWGIYMAVSPPDLQKAREAVVELVQQYLQEGPSEKEIQDARQTLIGKFKVINGLHSGALANQLLRVVIEELGIEYMDQYEDRIRSVTPEQVHEAVRRLIRPEHMSIAMAGGLPE
ncbi:MAG: pitrilysin family protein [candidate division KSB1 bacterium]|nr:pitrilysin family protein [candidate division KSB1 bacterium]